MANQQSPHRTKLPAQLASADRVWQEDRAKRFFGKSIKWLAAAFVVLILLDVIFHLSPWARLGGSALWVLATIVVVVAMLWIALVSQSPLERIARLLESRSEALGSKLINMIQLQQQVEDEALSETTRAFARSAVEQADTALEDMNLQKVARTPMLRHELLGAWVPILVVMLLGVVFLRIASVEALRFIDPFGNHPPFAFTTLTITTPDSDEHSVVYKENAMVEVEWIGHDPKDLYLSAWDPADKVNTLQTLPMIRKTKDGFVQQLENVTTDLVVVAHNKAGRAKSIERKISVLLTPQITESKVEIALPEYTRVKPREIPYHYKTVQTLKDSMLTFSISSNRPLSEGEITVTSSDGEVAIVKMSPLADHPETVAGSLMARGSSKLDFVIRDVGGIASEAVLSGGLTVTNDLAPVIRITEPYADSFIVITHELNAAFECSDDYGISALRLHRALNGVFSPPKSFQLDDQPKRHNQTIPFHVSKLGVEPGDVISFFAEVTDNAPETQLVRSDTRHLMVISEEQYNEQMRTRTDLTMIEDKFDSMLEDFDQLVEEQERLAEELKKLTDPNSELGEAEKQQELEQLLAEQEQLNSELRDHADAMDNFSRDKPLYDMERDMQKKLSERAESLRQSAQLNDLATGKSRQKQDSELAQQAALDQLETMRGYREKQQQDVAEPLESMAEMHELMKHFNHYQDLYQQQKEIAGQSSAYDSNRQLDNTDRMALQDLARREQDIGQQLEQLAEKLREDAAAAEEDFPKAAQSGRQLADKIDQARLPELAEQASESMLDGKGPESAERSERLRREMEDIMNGCQSCQNGGQSMSDEIDQFLSFNGMTPGQSFGQMMQSRMFGQQPGQGSPGMGGGMGGMGYGSAGNGGRFGSTYSPNMGMLGGDSDLGNGNRGHGNSRRSGKGTPGQTASDGGGGEADTLPEIKPVTRESKTVTPEILAEQYRGIVEEYFRALTRPQQKPSNPTPAGEKK